MIQLVYSSIAPAAISDNDIVNILLYSYDYNVRHGITGCLVYHGNEFLHLLEGEHQIVTDLFKRIEADERHKHVTYLYSGEAVERIFDQPYMAGDKLVAIAAAKLKWLLSGADLVELKGCLAKTTSTVKFFWTQVQQLLDTPKSRHNTQQG